MEILEKMGTPDMETFLAKIDKKMGENGIFGRNFDYFCFSKDVFFDVVTSLCYFPTLYHVASSVAYKMASLRHTDTPPKARKFLILKDFFKS